MGDPTKSAIKLLQALTERAKELTCIYAIEELLNSPGTDIDQVCRGIIEAIPPGWQFPDVCRARLTLEDRVYQSPDFEESEWVHSADVRMQDKVVGRIGVYYTREMPVADHGPFLQEENKLIQTIADRLGHFMVYQKMERVVQELRTTRQELSENRIKDWEAVLDLLRQTDNDLFLSIANKMLNHLCWSGVAEAEGLRASMRAAGNRGFNGSPEDANRSHRSRALKFTTEITERVFQIAGDHLGGSEILSRIQMWIHEDKLSALVQTVQRHLPISEIIDALRRYYHTAPDEIEARYPVSRGLKVSLIRRILSDRLDYINLVKTHVDIEDLFHLLQNVVFSPDSHGKLGRKSAEFFLASRILIKARSDAPVLEDVRIPRTWYVSSDMMLHYMHHNNMDEIIEQKYKEIDRVRMEYPHVRQSFIESDLPPELVTGLSVALDDLGERPLIVKSSSVLEERIGFAFHAKHKTLFIANQGTKQERLANLMRAVAEVYASAFGPGPVEHRADHEVLDFSEEMGIMIQEAVGTRCGPYFFPSYTCVASSHNELCWSREIRPEDGVVRILPGLGPRPGDPYGDNHPVFFAPGQPGRKVNTTDEETIRYAPGKIDVFNLDTNAVETVEVATLLRRFGADYPGWDKVFSFRTDGRLERPGGRIPDFENEDPVVTFDGLIAQSPFVVEIRTAMRTLEDKLGRPVEVQFASDGDHLYLVQCRPQSRSEDADPAPIPKDLPREKVVFTANRYVASGRIPDITHVIYVDPIEYEALGSASDRDDVAKAIGELNRVLPKRKFVLVGPGQWGGPDGSSPGVNVTYRDIDNTALLIEIDRKANDECKGFSFGTHFFQELVESRIRYLPVCVDDDGVILNERFLKGRRNILPDVLPRYAHLTAALRLIDVPQSEGGKVLQVLMNADLDEAVGILVEPRPVVGFAKRGRRPHEEPAEEYWRWRHGMAEQIARELDAERFGVAGFYLFGSTKNGTAGPGSDVDVLVHFRGNDRQREDLENWLEGWSLCLDEINYLRTGYRSKGLLDVHIVTDEDIARKTSYAVKINAVTDAARPLEVGPRAPVNGR